MLLVSKDKWDVKVIDFGLSAMMEKNLDGNVRKMKLVAGSTLYMSPEVIAGSYEKSCDLWSAGVILYEMLAGYPPFTGNDDNTIFSKIKAGAYDFHEKEW